MVSILGGCSSSIFTGGKGTELDHLNGDGRFNKLCKGLNLSTSSLDVPTARALVTCLNSNGSIPEYAALVAKMTDSQLGVMLDVVNAEIMTQPTRLRQLDQSFTQMDQRGIWDRGLSKLAVLLKKGKFVRAAINLARQGTHTGSSTQLDPSVLQSIKILAQEITDQKTGPAALTAARANLDRALGTGAAMSALKSFKAMVTGLNSKIPALPGNSLPGLTTLAHEYLKAKISARDQVYAKVLLWGIADGTLFNGLDYFYNGECELSSNCPVASLTPDDQIAGTEAFMRTLTLESSDNVSNRQILLKPLTDLFHTMDRPIFCMADTKVIPNGDMFVMSEIASLNPVDVPQWLIRSNAVKIKLANSMCNFPGYTDGSGVKTFNQLFDVMRLLAKYETSDGAGHVTSFGRPLITVAHLLKGLEVGDASVMAHDAAADLAPFMAYPATERYRRFLVHWMGDENVPSAYTNLTDALAELSRKDRGVLANMLYFLNAPQKTLPGGERPIISRDDLRKVTQILMTVRPELKTAEAVPGSAPVAGRSLFDVAENALLTVDINDLIVLLQSVSEFIDGPDELVTPLVEVARDSLLVNDVDPIVEIGLNIARDAENRKQFFQTLFDVANTKQFEDAMALTAKMAQNGTLKELLQGILTLFKGTSDLGQGNALAGNVPPVKFVSPADDHSTDGRPAWVPAPATWPVNPAGVQACYALNFDVRFGDTLGSNARAWHDQMDNVAACANANGDNAALEQFLHYGNTAEVTAGRSMLAWLVNLASDIIPSADDPMMRGIYDELTNLMVDPSSFADMQAMNRMLPLMMSKKFCATFPDCPRGTEEVSIMQAAGRMSTALVHMGDDLQRLLNVSRPLVENASSPRASLFLYDSYWDADEMTTPVLADAKPPLESFPLTDYNYGQHNHQLRDMLDAAIRKYEKREPTEIIRGDKLNQFWKQPFTGIQSSYQDYQKRTRVGVGYENANALKSMIKPFLDELSQDSRLEWTMAYFFNFDNNPYSPEWWADWFKRLANEVKPIPYYYPGSYPSKNNPPTVRLVSQLDLLEMVVIDADFSLNELGQPLGFLFSDPDANFAIKYLTAIANSGRDITPAVDAMDKELTFFTSLMGDPILGAALKPEVKRRLYNLKQDFQILRDTNVERDWVLSNGKKVHPNDLGVLRDLFKAVLSATPVADRGNYRRDKNSLALITKLVSSGLLRNAGTNVLRQNADGQIVANDLTPILRFLIESTLVIDKGYRKINAGARDVLGYLLRDNCDKTKPNYSKSCNSVGRANWPKEPFNDRYVLAGKLIDQFFAWTYDDDKNEDQGKPRVMTYIKRTGYDLVSLIDRLNFKADGSRDTYTPALVPTVLKPVFGTKKGTEIIAANIDLVQEVLTDPGTVRLLELVTRGESDRLVDFNAVRATTPLLIGQLSLEDGRATESALDLAVLLRANAGYQATKSAIKWARRDSEYKNLCHDFYDRIVGQLRSWVLRDNTALRPRLQTYLGNHMGNGDLRDLTVFIGKESKMPDERFYNSIKFIGEFDAQAQTFPYINKLNDFLDLLHRGIVENNGLQPANALSRFTLRR
ncbi:MAG: hypothetical protein HY074_20220 [Deltaproteobacteria bacterium]|nr:hypothetical protein [Deltaproteobacteria bacterium]